MRKPVVDYRELRLSRLNEPRFSHLKLLGGWIIYFALYFLTENLIPVERCHVIHSRLDDLIPFTEGFLIIYCYWYLLIVASLLWFLLYDIRSFRNLQIFIMIVQALAMIIYIFWPSVQMLRPESFERDNFLTRAMAFVYSFDTPTGVFPSLHVSYSIGIASSWCHRKGGSKLWKAFMILSAVMISLSTAFVKQHSVLDIFGAIPICLIAEYSVFGNTRLHRWIEGKEEPHKEEPQY